MHNIAVPTVADATDLAKEGIFIQDVYRCEPLEYYFEDYERFNNTTSVDELIKEILC
jgi:hypothetical protein